MCSAKNLYSAIDSSSIINIDLTSNADLALGVKFGTFYGTARRLDYVSGKLFGKIAAGEGGNNLLRMQRQIINFFSAFSVVIYASGWTFLCHVYHQPLR